MTLSVPSGSRYYVLGCVRTYFGCFRVQLMGYRDISGLLYGVFRHVSDMLRVLRCVPSCTTTSLVCFEPYNDGFTSPTRYSEPYVGFFFARALRFFGCEVSEPDEYFLILLVVTFDC